MIYYVMLYVSHRKTRQTMVVTC